MNREQRIEAAYNYGREQALALRTQAPELTDTEVIDKEAFIPAWREGVQVLGAPVAYMDQVYRVLQAHDSTGNPGWNPVDTPALFGLCHTTNPMKAKPWVAPLGTSGVYKLDECYVDGDDIVRQQIFDGDNVFDAVAMPNYWKIVGTLKNGVFTAI